MDAVSLMMSTVTDRIQTKPTDAETVKLKQSPVTDSVRLASREKEIQDKRTDLKR